MARPPIVRAAGGVPGDEPRLRLYSELEQRLAQDARLDA
jgi:hypothetical protein